MNKLIEYSYENKVFSAYIAKPSVDNKKLTTVLICHAWAGRDKFVDEVAERLAEHGYCAVALDAYGKGLIGETTEQKMALMMPLVNDRAKLQAILKSGYEKITALDYVDADKIITIGYCFGGLCSLDMARMGLPLRGAISIHGTLHKPNNLTQYQIKAKILALHGHLDPMVLQSDLDTFMQEMDAAKADWQAHIYGQALHAFTNPEANDYNLGTVYNKMADKRSWETICQFLKECS